MAEAVSSGLGRRGPWLQNAWLRVEARQDDASISPVALRPSWRAFERALAFVDLVDEPPLHFERAEYDVRPYEDALGRGRMLVLTSRLPGRGAVLRREIALYDHSPALIARLGVTNERGAPLRLDALHAFASPPKRGSLQFAAPPGEWRIYRHGWQSWSPTL